MDAPTVTPGGTEKRCELHPTTRAIVETFDTFSIVRGEDGCEQVVSPRFGTYP